MPVSSALAEYVLELGSYPPHFTVGFMSNNPALYDILPQVKQYIHSGGTREAGRRPPISKLRGAYQRAAQASTDGSLHRSRSALAFLRFVNVA